MSFLVWLEETWPGTWVREAQTIFAFPFVLFLHTLGLGIVAGLGVALDVWILRFAERHPMAPMERFFPAIWIGFTIALASGILLLLAYPTKALTDGVFWLKIGMIVAALGLLQWLRRRIFVDADPTVARPVSRSIKVVAGVSIALWIGAVFTGRLLAYTYNYLTASDLLWSL